MRFQAVRATSAFVLLHEKEVAIQKHLEPLLPAMVGVLGESVVRTDDETLLKSLIELAESCPKFLRPQLEHICELCMKVSHSGLQFCTLKCEKLPLQREY